MQYGPRITAIILYLYVEQVLSKGAPPRPWPSCSHPGFCRHRGHRDPVCRARVRRLCRVDQRSYSRVRGGRVRRNRSAQGDAEHQLCCAHALRELASVANTAPEAEWCSATQAADALVVIQTLVTIRSPPGDQITRPPFQPPHAGRCASISHSPTRRCVRRHIPRGSCGANGPPTPPVSAKRIEQHQPPFSLPRPQPTLLSCAALR